MQPAARLSSREYLEQHDVAFYLEDAVGLLLDKRDDQPLDFIADYFEQVLHGTHVLLRDFSYVNRCAHSRWSFVRSAREALSDFDQTKPTSAADMTQLLRLVCPDFPLEVVTEGCQLCGDMQGSHPLGALLHATCVQLCYAEFLRRMADAFEACDPERGGRVDRSALALALSETAAALSPQPADDGSEGYPPTEAYQELVGAGGSVSLLEAVRALTHSEAVLGAFALSSVADEHTTLGSSLFASPQQREGVASAPSASSRAGGGAQRAGSAGAARSAVRQLLHGLAAQADGGAAPFGSLGSASRRAASAAGSAPRSRARRAPSNSGSRAAAGAAASSSTSSSSATAR